tara:strand:- start:7673 stop:8023 length:351 start_codon:yes stop_codon:yes gene_type:complete
MYFIVFARYDSWSEFGSDSGRYSYLTDDLADADARWYDMNHAELTDDCGFTVRRGGVFGSFPSLDDPRLRDFLHASDEVDGRTDLLERTAWEIAWENQTRSRRRSGTSAATAAPTF